MNDMIGGVPLTRAERLGKAHEHEQLMIAKYRTGILGEIGTKKVPDNYHLWQEVIEYVDNEGNNRSRIHREYPLPYTDGRYFRRFLELFLCRGAEIGLTYKLSKEFEGDEVDSDYIGQLLITAEEYHLFEDDTAICFYEDNSYLTYRPSQYRPPQVGVFNSILNGVPMYDIIVGSEANIARAKMVRRWLKKRKKALGMSWAAPRTPAARLLEPAQLSLTTAAPTAPPEAITPQISKSKSRNPQAGTPTSSRAPESIDALFSWAFKTTHCDRLAKMVDLSPPIEAFVKVSHANTRIWAVVKTIKSGQSYSSKTEAALARALGNRYGYVVSNKLSKVNENRELPGFLEHLKHHIARWKQQGEIN